MLHLKMNMKLTYGLPSAADTETTHENHSQNVHGLDAGDGEPLGFSKASRTYQSTTDGSKTTERDQKSAHVHVRREVSRCRPSSKIESSQSYSKARFAPLQVENQATPRTHLHQKRLSRLPCKLTYSMEHFLREDLPRYAMAKDDSDCQDEVKSINSSNASASKGNRSSSLGRRAESAEEYFHGIGAWTDDMRVTACDNGDEELDPDVVHGMSKI